MYFVYIFAHVTTVLTGPANLSQLHVPTNLFNDESEDNLSSDDEYHNAIDDDKIHISNHNQDDELLELNDLLSDEEDNGDDVDEVRLISY